MEKETKDLIKNLNKYESDLYNANLDSCITNYKDALKLSKEINYKEGIANSYLNIARYFYYSDKNDISEIYLDSAKTYSNIKRFPLTVINIWNLSALNNMSINKIEKSEDNLLKALNYIKKNPNDSVYTYLTLNMGVIQQIKNNPALSLTYNLEAHRIASIRKDTLSMIISGINLGTLYLRYGNYKRAELFFKHGLAISSKKRLEYQKAVLLSRYGATLLEQNIIKNTDTLFLKSIDLLKKNNKLQNADQAYRGLGRYHMLLKNYNESERMYKTAYNISINTTRKRLTLEEQANLYITTRKLKEAKRCIDEIEKLRINSNDNRVNKSKILKLQYKYYKASNKSELADYYFVLLSEQLDKQQKKNDKILLDEIYIKYKYYHEDIENNILKLKEKKAKREVRVINEKRSYIIAILLSLISILIVSYVFYSKSTKVRNKKSQISNLKSTILRIISEKLEKTIKQHTQLLSRVSRNTKYIDNYLLQKSIEEAHLLTTESNIVFENLAFWSMIKQNENLEINKKLISAYDSILLVNSKLKCIQDKKNVTLINELTHSFYIRANKKQFNLLLSNLLYESIYSSDENTDVKINMHQSDTNKIFITHTLSKNIKGVQYEFIDSDIKIDNLIMNTVNEYIINSLNGRLLKQQLNNNINAITLEF